MYERILVPLDGSKVGETALPYVEELVAKLTPNHVPVPYTERELKPIKQRARNYLNRIGESLRRKGAVVKTKIGTGKAAEEIIKAAEEINADLVAMSTHGRSGLSRWALGSVTDKVLRAGKVPLLIIRAPKE